MAVYTGYAERRLNIMLRTDRIIVHTPTYWHESINTLVFSVYYQLLQKMVMSEVES